MIEPDSEKPRCLIRHPPGPHWTEGTVQDDLQRETVWNWPPNLEGTNQLRAAVHGDTLFYLKCARNPDGNARIGSKMAPMDKVSLICFKPGRKEPLEIPLSFQPEAVKPFLAQSADDSLLTYPPEFSSYDLKTTSAGLFFNFNVYPPESGIVSNSPGLLCVTWKDVNDWLTRHGHTPIGTRTPALPESPPR